MRIIYSDPVTPNIPYDFCMTTKSLQTVLPISETSTQNIDYYQIHIPVQNPEPELMYPFIPGFIDCQIQVDNVSDTYSSENSTERWQVQILSLYEFMTK